MKSNPGRFRAMNTVSEVPVSTRTGSPIVVDSVPAFRTLRDTVEGTVGFVPTMGALHSGHQSLMSLARRRCDWLVVSIFINPTQFAPGEDLDIYPRDREGDLQKCAEVGVDCVFFPDVPAMYPGGAPQPTFVEVRELTNYLCGASRPNHFRGVTTVVAKLFNIVEPDLAVFGQKDYQQLATIRQMVQDLNFDIEIVAGPTHREHDGLAMSSRNRNIPDGRRPEALTLSRGLANAWELFRSGSRDVRELEDTVRDVMQSFDTLELDYVRCVHPDTLEPYESRVTDDGAVLACAARVGPVRLIDNLRLDAPLPESLKEIE